MSKTIYRSKAFSLTQFYGGTKKGISIQVTQSTDKGYKYIQLNKREVKQLLRNLNKWVKTPTNPEANK